jgi:uncharacterized protein YraI
LFNLFETLKGSILLLNNTFYRPAFVTCLILLLVASLSTVSFQLANGQETVQARVYVEELNVRQTPDIAGTLLGQYTQDTMLNVQGRENIAGNGTWVSVEPAAGGISGWVVADYLAFPPGFNIDSLPVINTTGANAPVNDNPVSPSAQVNNGELAGVTTALVNFRSGPGLNHSILRTVPADTAVAFTGRNGNNTWFQARVGTQQGWLFYTLVSVSGDSSSLPLVPDTESVSSASSGSTAPAAPANVVSGIGATSHQIFLRGQELGNRADVFSKVGDSITASRYFLYPIGVGGLQIGAYTNLQPVIDYFSQTPARTHNSFANESLAARGGWTSGDLLDPQQNVPGVCQFGETPLACEYRVTQPALALIMIGSNEVTRISSDQYRANLSQIVQTSIDMGVIPVLSTLPDMMNNGVPYQRVYEFNTIIRSVAASYGVPVWDYWSSLQDLPNHGLGGDNLHPSVNPATGEAGIFTPGELRYGYNMRNLTALQVLDAIWRNVLY